MEMTVKVTFLLATMAIFIKGFPLDNNPELLTYSSTRNENGYDFSYSTDDQSRDEHAVIVLQKDGDQIVEVLEIRGSYSFIGDDNRRYTVEYVSGIDGFRFNQTITDVADERPPSLEIDPNALKSLVG